MLLTATLELSPGTLLILGQNLGSGLQGGVVSVDLQITDLAGGAVSLLEGAVNSNPFDFSALNQLGVPQGSVVGAFDVTGGDATFQGAFGSEGDFNSLLTFAVSSVCDLTALGEQGAGPNCVPHFFGNDLVDFTAQPTATVTPVGTPEPATAGLLALGLLGLAALKRTHVD